MKVKVSQPTQSVVSSVGVPTQNVVSSVGVQGPVGPAGPSGPNVLSSASDVDTTQLSDGSLLVYDTEKTKWVATIKLEKQSMNGGFF